jgi:hypothetical protein
VFNLGQRTIMVKRLFMVVVVLFCLGVWGTASNAEEGKNITKSSYVGVWKVEKVMYQPGQKWKKADHPFTMQIFPNGKFVTLQPVPNPIFRVTGAWKILDDRRLQISEEEQNGEPFQTPTISVFSLENGRLNKPAKSYVNENEKAQLGLILKKMGR